MNTVSEGFAPFLQYQTWYRITGDLHNGMTPLVVVHGGPGCTHDYVDSFKDIANTGRPVVHYDQLGNGRSTHLREKPADFWQIALFLDELDNLLKHLNIQDDYALLGQSWGGILISEHAVRCPTGLKAIVIANSPASIPLWLQAAANLRAELPEAVQATLLEHELLPIHRFFWLRQLATVAAVRTGRGDYPEPVLRLFHHAGLSHRLPVVQPVCRTLRAQMADCRFVSDDRGVRLAVHPAGASAAADRLRLPHHLLQRLADN